MNSHNILSLGFACLLLIGCAGGGGMQASLPLGPSEPQPLPPPPSSPSGTPTPSPTEPTPTPEPPAPVPTPERPRGGGGAGSEPPPPPPPPPEPPPITIVSDVTYPLIGATLAYGGSGGLISITNDQSGSANVKQFSNWKYELHLSVPAAGIDATFPWGGPWTGYWAGQLDVLGLRYVTLGVWASPGLSGLNRDQQAPVTGTAFLFGEETPTGAMPTTGTADYAGSTKGRFFVESAGKVMTGILYGDVAVTVNFESGTLSGLISDVWAGDIPSEEGPPELWNDVSINASIAPGTSKFSGTTSSASEPASTFALKETTTGTINGGFYGPNADELGAVWTLSGSNGMAVGGIGAQLKFW